MPRCPNLYATLRKLPAPSEGPSVAQAVAASVGRACSWDPAALARWARLTGASPAEVEAAIRAEREARENARTSADF